jgi:hypothetical protein
MIIKVRGSRNSANEDLTHDMRCAPREHKKRDILDKSFRHPLPREMQSVEYLLEFNN